MAMGVLDSNTLIRGVDRAHNLQFAICYASRYIEETHIMVTANSSCYKGAGRSTKEILKRIDYGGSLTLMGAVSASYLSTPCSCSQADQGGIHTILPQPTLQRKPTGTPSQHAKIRTRIKLPLIVDRHLRVSFTPLIPHLPRPVLPRRKIRCRGTCSPSLFINGKSSSPCGRK